MDETFEELDAVEEHQWSRRGAVIRAMAERRRFFTVRLDLDDEGDEDGQRAPSDEDDPSGPSHGGTDPE